MKRTILTLLFTAIVLAGYSQANKIEFEEFDLDNGLHVILHEDHSTPIVAVSIMYHVGSKNEDPERTGFAHFFEHLLFEGSENIERGQFDKLITSAGGINNANTSNDRTFYYEILPSNQLELGLYLESERLLHAKVEKVGIETQREVVKEMREDRRHESEEDVHRPPCERRDGKLDDPRVRRLLRVVRVPSREDHRLHCHHSPHPQVFTPVLRADERGTRDRYRTEDALLPHRGEERNRHCLQPRHVSRQQVWLHQCTRGRPPAVEP